MDIWPAAIVALIAVLAAAYLTDLRRKDRAVRDLHYRAGVGDGRSWDGEGFWGAVEDDLGRDVPDYVRRALETLWIGSTHDPAGLQRGGRDWMTEVSLAVDVCRSLATAVDLDAPGADARAWEYVERHVREHA